MGHYLHDTLAQSYFPPLWGDSTYPTVGTAMTNPSYTAVIKLTQTYSPNLLNETAFLYSGNKITLTPINGSGTFAQPSGWTATSFFPIANNFMIQDAGDRSAGFSVECELEPQLLSVEERIRGLRVQGRSVLDQGTAPVEVRRQHSARLQEPATAGQHQRDRSIQFSQFSQDSYVNFLLGDASNFSQLQYLAGKHWVNNNYGFYANDNWHITPRLTLNIGLRYDGLPHAFERYNKFANFVPADYTVSAGESGAWAMARLIPASLSTFNHTGSEQFYLNGIREAGVQASRAATCITTTTRSSLASVSP